MNRRRYLGTLGAVGGLSLSGCLDSIPFVSSDTALGEPEQSRGDPIHPIHGEEFPSFELPDPFAETTVSSEDLRGTPFAMTFVYTSCTAQCGVLMQLLALIQSDAVERGYEDGINLLAVTFDPDTDTADELREYAELFGMDLDTGNFRFLRPESTETALELVNERFGVPAEVHGVHAHGDEDHDGDNEHYDDDHEHGDEHHDDDHGHGYEHHADHHDDEVKHHDDDPDHDRGPGIHYYMLFLINGDGITERSYPNVVGGREETRPNAILEDVRTVVD